MGKGIDLIPDGMDEDGWVHFRTSLGDRLSFREKPDGSYELRYPAEKYELKEIYNVESTGEVVIDLALKKPTQDS